jgi:hypothetical protein
MRQPSSILHSRLLQISAERRTIIAAVCLRKPPANHQEQIHSTTQLILLSSNSPFIDQNSKEASMTILEPGFPNQPNTERTDLVRHAGRGPRLGQVE